MICFPAFIKLFCTYICQFAIPIIFGEGIVYTRISWPVLYHLNKSSSGPQPMLQSSFCPHGNEFYLQRILMLWKFQHSTKFCCWKSQIKFVWIQLNYSSISNCLFSFFTFVCSNTHESCLFWTRLLTNIYYSSIITCMGRMWSHLYCISFHSWLHRLAW